MICGLRHSGLVSRTLTVTITGLLIPLLLPTTPWVNGGPLGQGKAVSLEFSWRS